MEGLYHVWFSTKGRRQALEGELGDDLRQLLIEIAERATIRLLGIETAADHVHLLVAVSGTQTLPSAMHQLKGATSRYILLKYPELKLDMGHNSFWQKGYGWRKIKPTEVERVRSYIRTQGSRALRHEH
ncbi:MAG TPA: IS200/IS605 family transposase [Dehalococcoidia bacterium]|nr:IS200/IS605 family transposase [Dehalococcoidia bacterium]